MKFIYIIISILYWGFVLVSSIFLFPISCMIKIITFSFDKNLKILHKFTSLWACLYTWLSPLWSVKIIDRNKIDKNKTYIIVSNHFSVTDIFAIYRLLIHFKWVSKSEIFKIPFVGWNMSLNKYIKLDRGSMKGNAQMMKESEKALNLGSSIIIFPEGTRSTTNEIREFKKGAFELALRTQKTILPIMIEGSQLALPKKGVILSGSHHIIIKVLNEVPYESFCDKNADDISNEIRQNISNELNEIRKGQLNFV